MKMIEAMIRREKFDDVRKAMDAAGFGAMTVTDVLGRGLQKGVRQEYRGVEYVVDLLPKLKVEMVVPDAAVDKAIDVLKTAAYTGKIGDGMIFVMPVEMTMRVRTGEKET
jgi:nitrogen regulatory protein P-II 1